MRVWVVRLILATATLVAMEAFGAPYSPSRREDQQNENDFVQRHQAIAKRGTRKHELTAEELTVLRAKSLAILQDVCRLNSDMRTEACLKVKISGTPERNRDTWGALINEPVDEHGPPDAFQGDMMLTPEQRDRLSILLPSQYDDEEEEENRPPLRGGRVKRKATAFPTYHWPHGIVPIEFDRSITENDNLLQRVINALYHWMANTCLEFLTYTPELEAQLGHSSRVYFRTDPTGCSSRVGRVSEGRQNISIGENCNQFGNIVHEIGHAIGLHHEQSRPDRDFFVDINWDNIEWENRAQFISYEWETVATHNVPYDLGSIMHYGPRAFSSNGLPTLTAWDPTYNYLLGQRDGLSPGDIMLTNIMYGCQNPE